MKIMAVSLSLLMFCGLALAEHEEAHHETGAAAHAPEAGGQHHKAPLFPQPTANKDKATRPPAPQLTEPSFMSKISNGQVTLKWSAVERSTHYHLQVATDPNFKWLAVNENLYTGTSYDLKNLEADKHYYWRVAAQNSANDAGYATSAFAKSMFETPEKQ